MNNLRKIVGFLMVLMLAAFALPSTAAAPAKYFTVSVSPTSLSSPANGVPLTLSFANASPQPNSNSAINSLIVTLPAGTGLQINSISVPSPASYTLVPPTAIGPNSGPVPGPLQIKVNGIAAGGLHVGDPAFVVTINVTETTCHAFAFDAQAFAGNSWSGDVFTLVPPSNLAVGCVFTGNAACNTQILTGDPAADGRRGTYNKGGTCADAGVDYTFYNNGPADGSTILKYDRTKGAAFSYTVTGKAEDVDSTGWPKNHRPVVAWDLDGSSPPIPSNISFAVACVSSSLPAPYGVLASAISATQTTLTLTVDQPIYVPLPPVPFPIEVENERMQVTATSGGPSSFTLTVIRGTGNLGADAATHNFPPTTVASTPLPIDPNPTLANGLPNPYYHKQDQMCIAERGWTSYDIDPATGVQRIRWWSLIFDLGDGFYDDGN
jgi:hypothetical protein